MARREDEHFEVEEIELDVTRRSYTIIQNYFKHFWTPIVGLKPASVYEMILSFAHGTKDECYPSLRLLADTLGIDKNDLTGRKRKDNRTNPPKEYFQKGIFQILEEHGLIKVQKSDGHYKFKVVKAPPLLSQEQLAKLPAKIQKRHRRLLETCQNEEKKWVTTPSILGDDANFMGITAIPKTTSKKTKEKLIPKIQNFYKKCGKPITKYRLNAGVKILLELEKQGHSFEQLLFGLEWMIQNKDRFGGQIHSVKLLQSVIDEAVQDMEKQEIKSKKVAQQKKEQKEQDQQLEMERQQLQESEERYKSLSAEEQEFLREQAIKNLKADMKSEFLLEPMIIGEVCRLVEERQ